jgi:hypothetical protein
VPNDCRTEASAGGARRPASSAAHHRGASVAFSRQQTERRRANDFNSAHRKTIELRHNVHPLGTIGNRARLRRMNALSNWSDNRLLLALPSRDLKRIMPELEYIRCQREQVLLDADDTLDHVFFPDSGVVSVVAVYADGSVIEMATIGREGCTGMQAFFGAKTSSVRLLVQIPGSAAKMSRAAFLRAMESMPSFRNLRSRPERGRKLEAE